MSTFSERGRCNVHTRPVRFGIPTILGLISLICIAPHGAEAITELATTPGSEQVERGLTRDARAANATVPSSTSIRLVSPADCQTPEDISLCIEEPVTVFRWTPSANPAVASYRLLLADDRSMRPETIVLELSQSNFGGPIIAPQVAVRLDDFVSAFEGLPLFWRVVGLDSIGNPVEQSEEVFLFAYESDERGFTIISGLVTSDQTQLALVGARVALSGPHAAAANSSSVTLFNGEYIVIALTTDDENDPVEFPILVSFTRDGYAPLVVEQADERVGGEIELDVEMMAAEDNGTQKARGTSGLPFVPLLLLED